MASYVLLTSLFKLLTISVQRSLVPVTPGGNVPPNAAAITAACPIRYRNIAAAKANALCEIMISFSEAQNEAVKTNRHYRIGTT